MEKIINNFMILEQAPYEKDYVATQYKIDLEYKLKVGDRVYRLGYEKHGLYMWNCCILEITKDGLKVTDGYSTRFMDFVLGEKNMIIYPFPEFKLGITNKTFCKITKTYDDFALEEEKWDPESKKVKWFKKLEADNLKKYENNFKNVLYNQLSLF